MEIWDVYDMDRNKTDRSTVRGQPFQDGDYHLVVLICIFNSRGEMLIQQRQPFKEGWPDMWDLTVGGSATLGDTSRMAAQREVLEEIGLKLDLTNVTPHLSINGEHVFTDIYLIEKDVDISRLTLQAEEVSRVKWASREEIFSMIDSRKFIPYYESLIQLLFDTRRQPGSRKRE